MKTHIIQLEEYDDIISARDKMGWARGERILLVWPERRAVLERRLDLVLLQRRAAAAGAQLGLATRSREVRYYALRLGIPVFKSLRQAQNDNWRLPRPFRQAAATSSTSKAPRLPAAPAAAPAAVETPAESGDNGAGQAETPLASTSRRPVRPESEPLWPLTQRQRLGLFALGVLAVLAIAATLLPQARIAYTPQTRVQEVLIDVQASPAIHTINLAGQVPAHWTAITVEGRDTMPASGRLLLPEEAASGQIEFTNLTDQAVAIPRALVVRTLGEHPVRFTITQPGTLPAGPGKQLKLPAQALAPGTSGNLAAGSLVAIEGLLGTQVKANNPQATQGGSDRQEPAPTVADRSRLAEKMHRALLQTAQEELFKSMGSTDLLIPSSLTLVQTLEEAFLPAQDGVPADQLRLDMQLEFKALVVTGADLRLLAANVFDANLPAGFLPETNSLRWENMGPPRLAEADTYRWQIHAYRPILAQTDLQEALRVSLGATPGRASRKLQEALHLEEPPQISVQPAWWPVLPVLPFRVTFANQVDQASQPDD